MIDEPDIVKQLREEERIGKLQVNQFDFKTRFLGIIGIKKKEIQYNESKVDITSYKDELNLAKKVLNDLNKN
jgi:hypothetical protein